MAIATLTSKHQVTIPREVRQRMNLCAGDRIEFAPDRSGKFVLAKCRNPQLSDGAAAKFMRRKKRLSVEEMKAAARAGALRSFPGADA